MSRRYRSSYITANPPALGTPNAGIWTSNQQFSARGQGLWPAPPAAPTIGTVTAAANYCASVPFTAPTCTGYPAGITNYTVVSTPGCVTATGTSSPILVTGLTACTSYTFRVRANGSNGLRGAFSGASNSITAQAPQCAIYTTPGTYSWVAPAGVTSVSVVAIGGGGSGRSYGGGGGGLGYRNNIAVTPGSSYTVVVGGSDSTSYFINTSTVRGGGASTSLPGGYTGDGGGSGGVGMYNWVAGGAGAGGYAGNGGDGVYDNTPGNPGNGGGGGSGGGGTAFTYCCGYTVFYYPGNGGGTALFGQGASGAGGAIASDGGTGSFRTGKGAYGGGAGAVFACNPFCRAGLSGAVRIVWPGTTKQFPSTNVGP